MLYVRYTFQMEFVGENWLDSISSESLLNFHNAYTR